jgi:hypothetical protein
MLPGLAPRCEHYTDYIVARVLRPNGKLARSTRDLPWVHSGEREPAFAKSRVAATDALRAPRGCYEPAVDRGLLQA